MDETLTRQAEAREIAFQELPENVRFYLECELDTYRAQGFEPTTYKALLTTPKPATNIAILIASLAKAPYRELRSPLGYYIDTYRMLQPNPIPAPDELDPYPTLILDNSSSNRRSIPYHDYVDWGPIPINRARYSELCKACVPADEAFEYRAGVSSEGYVDYHAFTDLVWFFTRE